MIIGPGPDLTKTIEFNENIFFTFVLPPIIFSAGYNLRRTSFFKYFMYIISFGVVGTVICFLVVTPLTYIMNYNEFFTLYYSPKNLHLRNYTQNIYNNTNTILNKIKKEDLNYINENFRSFNNSNIYNETNDNNITYNNITEAENNERQKIIINLSLTEILLFASVISATDTIAALTFIHEDSEPKLFAILFGEGVLNDAVCIVLYRILRDFTSSGEEFTTSTPFMMFSSFLSLAFFSFIVGMFVGCFCAYVLKKFKESDIKLNRMQEISVILFFAFISYTLAEECGLSPIVSLLFSGLFMSHSAFYNLRVSKQEKKVLLFLEY
jgi:NhaP-type Na+/H+ or K+/H+ antiporter